jgi:hypothetical protein
VYIHQWTWSTFQMTFAYIYFQIVSCKWIIEQWLTISMGLFLFNYLHFTFFQFKLIRDTAARNFQCTPMKTEAHKTFEALNSHVSISPSPSLISQNVKFASNPNYYHWTRSWKSETFESSEEKHPFTSTMGWKSGKITFGGEREYPCDHSLRKTALFLEIIRNHAITTCHVIDSVILIGHDDCN